MLFSFYDFDSMREYIRKLPATPAIRNLRLTLFDIYRYQEEYEKIYELIEHFNGTIQ